MSFWRRLRGGERKSTPVGAIIASALSDQMRNLGGARVSPETAMRCPAVRACVALVSESLASLPLHVHRRLDGGGKDRAPDHPLSIVLLDPNPWTSGYELRRALMADLLTRGACFATIIRVGGAIRELHRLDPRQVTVDYASDGEPSYRYSDSSGRQVAYAREEIFNLMALDGHAPIVSASEAIGLALLLERHGNKLFGAGARPGGVLETDKQLTPQVIERLKASFENGFAGAANAGRTTILEDGLKFKPLTLNSVDSQYVELRKFQVEEIARAFRVPLHKIGQLDRATFSNIEHQALEFVTDCLMPWLKLWEGAIRRSLLTPEERGEYFAEFLVDDLLRGDLRSRYEAFSQAALNGFLTVNEIRAAENRPPLPGGDVARTPLNTAPITSNTPAA